MDPSALGTTRIGLDGIRRDQDAYDRGDARIARARRRPAAHLARRGLAAALRRTASLLDPLPAAGRGMSETAAPR